MKTYLKQFKKKLKPHAGSLVSVRSIQKLEKNAKKYLNELAKTGRIERVCWGGYYIGSTAKITDFWGFMRQDHNFKIITGPTAASFWNFDFIHRDAYRVTVSDASFARVFRALAKKKQWIVDVSVVPDAEQRIPFRRAGALRVEDPEAAVVNCVQHFAFVDAFATLLEHPKIWPSVIEDAYWTRIAGSDVRVRQAIHYGCTQLNHAIGQRIFKTQSVRIKNAFIKAEIDEAVERVMNLA